MKIDKTKLELAILVWSGAMFLASFSPTPINFNVRNPSSFNNTKIYHRINIVIRKFWTEK